MKPASDGKPFSEPLKQALWQLPAILLLASLVGIGFNLWRNDGIPLIGAWSPEARLSDAAGRSLVISLDDAARLFQQDDVLFLDARPQSQYAEGHIQGALSLPWQEVDGYIAESVDRLAEARTIITYCDGESCDLSHELALFLINMGFKRVYVLVNGWSVWLQAGLPTGFGG